MIKIETQIDKVVFDNLKEELKQKQIDFFFEKFTKDDFKTSSKKILDDIIDKLFNTKIKEFIKSSDEIKNEIENEKLKKTAFDFAAKYLNIFIEFEKGYAKNYKTTVKELFTDSLIKRVEDAIDEPLKLEEKSVRELLDQKAIRELFVSVVYSALERFVKNIPFIGGMHSFEKDIKRFISHSASFTIDIATKFITDKKNEPLIQDSLKKVFHIILSQEIDLLINKLEVKGLNGKEAEIMKELGEHLLNMDMIKQGISYTLEQMYRTESEKTVKEFINDEELEQHIKNIMSEKLFDIFIKYINEDIVKNYIKNNITEYYDNIII